MFESGVTKVSLKDDTSGLCIKKVVFMTMA